jgi:hypothetical protein
MSLWGDTRLPTHHLPANGEPPPVLEPAMSATLKSQLFGWCHHA